MSACRSYLLKIRLSTATMLMLFGRSRRIRDVYFSVNTLKPTDSWACRDQRST